MLGYSFIGDTLAILLLLLLLRSLNLNEAFIVVALNQCNLLHGMSA